MTKKVNIMTIEVITQDRHDSSGDGGSTITMSWAEINQAIAQEERLQEQWRNDPRYAPKHTPAELAALSAANVNINHAILNQVAPQRGLTPDEQSHINTLLRPHREAVAARKKKQQDNLYRAPKTVNRNIHQQNQVQILINCVQAMTYEERQLLLRLLTADPQDA
jgi:hypothetical protein